MTNHQKRWSLQENSKAIATELAITGQRAIDAALEIADSMKARNQAAQNLCACMKEAAARLKSETEERAPLPTLLAECIPAWRQEEQSLLIGLSTAKEQHDARARSVSEAVDSMRRFFANSDAWELRAQVTLTQAASTEERILLTSEECTQLITEMGLVQAQLEAICQGVGR
jgi:hypothetical protein